MKADEYAKKFIETYQTDEMGTIADLFIALSNEVEEIQKMRRATSNSAVAAIMKDQNTKWNAVGNRLEKHFGRPILVRDGFLNKWKKDMPALNNY